ncbi:MAG: gliding motility-associated C-terminal domain-containing protein [Bacteroidota bacterium]
MKKSLLSVLFLLFICQLHCQIFSGCLEIDFEEIPNQTPFEGMVISDQYFASHGITFTLENGQSPVLAQVGGAVTAFGSFWGNDEPVPGSDIGEFFLTDDGNLFGLDMIPVIVTFANPIDSFSTCVLDIDFDEFFILEARGQNGETILADTIFSGDPNTGDGVPSCWGFNFDGCEGSIYSVRFEGFRQQSGAFGLGMDNFSFCFSGVDLVNQIGVEVNDPTCEMETGSLNIINQGEGDYLYSLDGINYQSSPIFTGLPIGTYDLFVQDPTGCEAEFSDIEIEAFVPLVINDVLEIPTSCGEDNGVLSINTDPSFGVNYSIDGVDFSTENSFTDLPPGTYPVFILDTDGCPYTTTATIGPSTAPQINGLVTTIDGCNDGSGQLVSSASGGTGTLTYSLNGGPSQATGNFDSLFAGQYVLEVIDEDGCLVRDTAEVEGGPLLLIESIATTPPGCSAPDGEIVIQASGGTGNLIYLLNGNQWSPSPIYTQLTADTFDITVVDAVGCTASAQTSLPIPVCPVFIPNVFSPNLDGQNDEFQVFTNGNYDVGVRKYEIFDRWGELVWRRENFTIHTSKDWWDGYFRGRPATQGVYVYVIELEYNNGFREVRAGDVCLIR